MKFQKYIKHLSERGIILAISSKNNYKDVKECFKENKNLFLKLNDFSIIKANWKSKYLNINEIAENLNIGKDSIVFFDDSKFERDQMKKFNPEVSTIDVPEAVDEYINSIEETAFFYTNTDLTKEDINKKNQYVLASKIKSFKSKFKDNENEKYLRSLKMKLTIYNIDDNNFLRCVQMLNKTNQFNLTTNRYTELSFKNYLKKNTILPFVIRLEDKFGDHGITGLITVKILKNKCAIDNFLLSCRILGREVEKVALNELLLKLKKIKIKFVTGIYKKSDKNSQCSDFYSKMGFEVISKEKFVLDLEKFKINSSNLLKVKHEQNGR